nr:MAG: RNA-dependent RNA polymerase [Skomarfal virus 20]
MEVGGRVPAICVGIQPTNVDGEDFKIDAKACEPCVHKRFLYQVCSPNIDLPPIYAHQGCAVNEYDSLLNRHIVPSINTELVIIKQGTVILKQLAQLLGVVNKYTNAELIRSRPQRMRKRYRRALQLEFKAVHATINDFVKFEKQEEIKTPRSIQYRATPYTARLAKYTVPIERAIASSWPEINRGYRFIAKGQNALERGEELFKMYCHFDNPFVYLIDHSKFDSRVNWRLLRMEHRFYLNIFPDPFLE